MQPDLRGIKLAVLGGDARQLVLVRHLSALGALLKVVGLPAKGENIIICSSVKEALEDVKAVILPIPGINEQGHLFSSYSERPLVLEENELAQLSPSTPVFVGMARPRLVEMAKKLNLKLTELMNLDEVAILNSIPSAEGAIQIAMENLSITIHDCNAVVLGFGRTGMTLSRMLVSLRANVTVVARNPAQRARAFEMGMKIADFSVFPEVAKKADVIFNTVPARVLDEHIISVISGSSLIVDLATAPGGTDFEAAKKAGIKAILAPGLPGKVAPKTAGQILARVVPRLLMEELTL